MPKFCAVLSLLLAAACSSGRATVVHQLDAASIDALPVLEVTPATLVCTATGYDECPLNSAYANRLGDGTIAIWEPGRRVLLLVPGDSIPAPLGAEGADRNYGTVVAIARAGARSYRLVTYDGEWRAITLSTAGDVLATDPLTSPPPLSSIGFIGDTPVLQGITGWSDDSARLTVTRLRSIRDTAGEVILEHRLPWLRGAGSEAPPLFPLIAAAPSWTLTSDGQLIWSPGDSLVIERRGARGRPQWRIEGGPGEPVTTADLDARTDMVLSLASAVPLVDVDLETMRASSSTHHPAISGLTASPGGVVYASGTATTVGDSIEIYRIGADGSPAGRLRLARSTRILLADGDSLLVHQPTEGEPFELRWLQVSGM